MSAPSLPEEFQYILDKREQNRKMPISRLPAELYSTIFLEVRDSILRDAKYSEDSRISRHYFGAKDWIRVAQICHAWRSLVLELPQFWSLIHLESYHPQWAAEMLSRSKNYPATIRVDLIVDDISEEQTADAFALLNTQVKYNISRLKELRLRRMVPEHLHDFFFHQLSAPALESFRMACFPSKVSSQSRPFVFSDRLLHASSLKRLSLVCCQIDWDSQIFSGLTHLRLSYLPEGHRVTVRRFISVISQISQLESLSIREIFDDDAHDDHDEFQESKVELPYLRHVHLSLDMNYMADFLLSIKLPSACMVRMQTLWDRRTEDPCENYYRITKFFHDLYRPGATQILPNQPRIQSLRIAKSVLEDFTVQAFYEKLSHDEMNVPHLHPPLNFYFGWEDWSNEGLEMFNLEMDALCPFLKALPLQDLAVLEIVGNFSNLDHMFWADHFGTIPTLESILLYSNSERLFVALGGLAVLTRSAGFPPDFVGLKKLYIQDPTSKMQLIIHALELREEMGYPIEHLRLLSPPSASQASDQAMSEVTVANCSIAFAQSDFKVWRWMKNVEVDSDSDDDVIVCSKGL
ncbi:hypothetical protein CPB83DRAFT_460192 [Crepidotus variabilis]|uniref:F-box domain-containing protein n=1 Tax=Crepidotus variabilis TaxID=179855 RepID=A0A9P6EBV0_9AGAR|nr:hypothetical protein CPB83DRAFT_460192 [Crepidotus variabilis]